MDSNQGDALLSKHENVYLQRSMKKAMSSQMKQKNHSKGKKKKGLKRGPSVIGKITKKAATVLRLPATAGIPPDLKVELDKYPHVWASVTMAERFIEEVWDHYDRNKDGILNKDELKFLAWDVVDRFIQLYLENSKPKNEQKQIRNRMMDEWKYFFPGSSVPETKILMADYLQKELDIDHDGIVTKNDFLFSWRNQVKQILKIKPNSKVISCVIL